MITIVSVSGGNSSFEALRRVIRSKGRENVVAVFADVKGSGESHFFAPVYRTRKGAVDLEPLLHERYGGEDRGLYRFLWEMSYALDIPIIRLEDERLRSIYTVMAENRLFYMINGNGIIIAKCSEELKRQRIARWIEQTYKPGECEIALGMDWTESHRVKSSQMWWENRLGWHVNVYSPLLESPVATTHTIQSELEKLSLEMGTTYKQGYEHRNCNQVCILGGLGQWAMTYRLYPDNYDYAMTKEEQLVRYWGKDNQVTILAYTHKGENIPITLRDFKQRVDNGLVKSQRQVACSCFGTVPMDFLAEIDPVKKVQKKRKKTKKKA